MTPWIALSDQSCPPPGLDGDGLVERGLMVVDLSALPEGGAVLLHHQADDGWPRTFSVFAHREAGVVILQRQGGTLLRHALPGPLPSVTGPVRISFAFDAPARHWTLSHEVLATGERHQAAGRNPLPLRQDDMAAICAGRRTDRHGAVTWFGVTVGASPPLRAPWFGLNTPIDTPQGPVAAGRLQPGDRVMTEDGPQVVHAVRRLDLPGRGAFAPVVLRAPYFGASRDIVVSADQLVAVSGTEVDYLFGEEAVLVPAGALIDQHAAVPDRRHQVSAVALSLVTPAVLMADGCGLLSVAGALLPLPRRVLERYEIAPLVTLMARQARRGAGMR